MLDEPRTCDNRWDEKAGLQRDALSSQVIGALEAQEIKETGEKLTTTTMQRTLNRGHEGLTVGLDLGDRASFIACLCCDVIPGVILYFDADDLAVPTQRRASSRRRFCRSLVKILSPCPMFI